MKKIVVFCLILLSISCEQEPIENPLLGRFASFENRFRFFFEGNEDWVEAVFLDSIFVSKIDSERIENTNVFVVSYRNGDFLYKRGQVPSLPKDVNTSSSGDTNFAQKIFVKEELETGRQWCQVSHEDSPIFKYQKNYFQTRLTNVSNEKIKVLRFGTFVNDLKKQYILQTSNNNYYTAENFQAWYTEDGHEWMAPGASVVDPVNRSRKKVIWAYHIQTESGEKYWTSAVYKNDE